jgi:hypothetical protein
MEESSESWFPRTGPLGGPRLPILGKIRVIKKGKFCDLAVR